MFSASSLCSLSSWWVSWAACSTSCRPADSSSLLLTSSSELEESTWEKMLRPCSYQFLCVYCPLGLIQMEIANRTLGWSVEIFVWSDRTGQVAKISARPRQSFNFQKIQGGQNIHIFCENWHGASFYINEQTQKYKFENWLFKRTILDPRKRVFLILVENPPKKFCSSCFGLDSALKTIDAQMFFWLAFLKTHKIKVNDCQKRHFGRFWQFQKHWSK